VKTRDCACNKHYEALSNINEDRRGFVELADEEQEAKIERRVRECEKCLGM